jgi:hypothetical protein
MRWMKVDGKWTSIVFITRKLGGRYPLDKVSIHLSFKGVTYCTYSFNIL